jgi:hypothetical protein
MQPRAIAFTFAALLLGIAAGGCGQKSEVLDEEAMARQVRTLASVSAEAAFVTQELRDDHLKPSFAASHLQDLAKDAARARQELAQPSVSMLEQYHAQAQTLAQQVVDALADIRKSQAGPAEQLRGEQQAMLRLKSELETLEKNL